MIVPQQRAIIALGNIGPAAKDAVPQLEQFLLANRYPAAAALHKINPQGNGLNFLIERVRDPTMGAAAIDQLGLLGSAGLPALDTLIEALRTDRGRDGGATWLSITEAVRKISPTNRAVISILIEKLNTSEKQVRQNVRPASVEMTASQHLADERLALAQKLVRFDPAEPHGLAVLAETVETDTEPNRRIFAAYLLRQPGAGARAAIPALKVALKDKEKPVRQAAVSALRKIEEDQSGN